ncbi:hypothetical protein FA95DRAFT_1607460 [Auriscalpium vulgare]|uniref:Uncharacterized protein n=1 Tax=Auriscalpium vulgare TaxID=40419 RepID=A0ACB8RNQ5_9AGAM|nr:hypothetical protein FA95DRAFT_1607460 [Auriscalpium vulgare]
MSPSDDIESSRTPDSQDSKARGSASKKVIEDNEPQSAGHHDGDSSTPLWMFSAPGEKNDQILTEGFSRDMDGTLVFTGLFSATVAAFLIESYKRLDQDPADTSVLLLSQIYQQLSANATTIPTRPANQVVFHAPGTLVAVNICWFLSLVFSISSALAATLVQQWSRKYIQAIQLHPSPDSRARIRAFLHEGVSSFHMSSVVDTIPLLLHIAVLLFLGGLVVFLWSVHLSVAIVVLVAVSISTIAYLIITVAPMVRRNCPYRTPLSAPVWFIAQALLIAILSGAVCVAEWIRPTSRAALYVFPDYVRKCSTHFSGGLDESLEHHAAAAKNSDPKALALRLKEMYNDSDFLEFVEGVPSFMRKDRGKLTIFQLLERDELGVRIGRLLQTCTGVDMSETSRVHRALVCMKTTWVITEWYVREHRTCWERDFGDAAVDTLNVLKKDENADVAVVARCTAALGATVLLHDLSAMTPFHKGLAYTVRKAVVALTDMPKHLQDAFLLQEGQDAYLFTLVDFLSGILRHNLQASDDSMGFVCNTLRWILRGDPWERDIDRASQPAREDFADLWRKIQDLIKGDPGSGASSSSSVGPKVSASSATPYPYLIIFKDTLRPIALAFELPVN